MSENQSNSIVCIKVIDEPELGFFYNVETRQMLRDIAHEPASTISVTKEAFARLTSGDSTFEDEAARGNLKLSQNYGLLVNFGKALRDEMNSSSDTT